MAQLRLPAAAALTLALLALCTAVAHADPNLARVRFFPCVAGDPLAKQVPANTPLYTTHGYVSGTRGLVTEAVRDITDTFTVTSSSGWSATIRPTSGPVTPLPDGTWIASYRVDLGSLAPGESMTIHWTEWVDHRLTDLVPPSDSWDPVAAGYPAWDGTGLKYHDLGTVGSHDLGTCTVTAVTS
jgi:hypothetical protein